MSETRVFTLKQNADKGGNLEEFTSDPYLIVKQITTAHLNHDGLPKPGTEVCPGMCLIAKFGTTASFDKQRIPDDMESLTTDEDELIARYSHMFYDASLYIPAGVFGIVDRAGFVDNQDGTQTAIVHVRIQ